MKMDNREGDYLVQQKGDQTEIKNEGKVSDREIQKANMRERQ